MLREGKVTPVCDCDNSAHLYMTASRDCPGRNSIEFRAGLVGHANAEHRTHAEKRIGLAGWSAVTSRYEETGFILWEVCSGGSHSDPWSSSSLPGESSVHGWWLGKSHLVLPLEVSLVTHSRPSIALTQVSLAVDI